MGPIVHFVGPSFAPLIALWGLVVTVLWLIICWRAMQAHEELAGAAQEILRKQT